MTKAVKRTIDTIAFGRLLLCGVEIRAIQEDLI